MKKNKKILIALGSMATVIAPIASAVSMSTNVTNRQATTPTAAQWQAFCKAVNDKSTENNLRTEWDAIKSKFFASDFYKERVKLQNGIWDIQDKIDLYSTLFSLLGDDRTKFTDAEKVTIAKFIVNNEAVADVFDAFGFDPRVTTDVLAIKAVTGNLIDPSKSSNAPLTSTDYQPNSPVQTILLKGVTGLNATYNTNTYHDIQLEVSNEDVLKYFVSIFARTKEWNDLRDAIVGAEDDVLQKSTIKEALLPVFNTMKVFNDNISSTKTTIDDLSTISLLDVFQNIDLNAASDDVAVFATMMNSKFGIALYGVDEAKSKLDSFTKAAPGSTHRKLLADGVVSDLLTRLDGIETIQSNQLEYLVKNGVSLDYNDKTANKRIESLLSFAKTLVDSSKLFTQDVQVRSRTSIIGNHSLSIKGDFNTILWKDIANTDLSVPFWTLTPDLASIGQDFGDTILEPSVQPLVDFHDNINIKYDVVSIDNNQAYIVEGDQSFAHNRWNLEIEFSNGTRETSQAIWFNSASSTTYVTPQFNFSDNSQQLTFTNSAVPINISKININIWKNNSSIAGTQQLQQDFVDFVNKAFLDEYNKIKDKVAILQATDPNAPTAFSINIKSLTVGYQELTCTPLGNDLWSVNVNGFVDANFNIDYDIIQNPNI